MTSSGSLRIGILASGEGSTLQAILDACAVGSIGATVTLVISNNRDSGALRRARSSNVAALHLSSITHPTAETLDRAILMALLDSKVDVVVLVGYMKKIGSATLSRFKGKILNTHPALLPKFGGQGMYGRHVHAAVLASGDVETGVSIHLVDAEYDTGTVVAQTTVPVMANDSVESLSERVQVAERAFLVSTLSVMAQSHMAPNPSVNADAPVRVNSANACGGAPVTLYR